MKILIIKLGALGDIVMSTPLVSAIINAHPDADIHILTTPPFRELFSGFSSLNVTAYPRHGIRNTLGAIRWAREARFDRVYDLQGSNRSGVITWLSGAAIRVGNHPRRPYNRHPGEPWRGQTHIFERMCEVLRADGIENVGDKPILQTTAADNALVANWMAEQNLYRGDFVLAHAGASRARPEKCWPHFGDLALQLANAGLKTVWIGAGADAAGNAELCERVGGIDATDRFSVSALVALGREARFAVTNDSGPMHILSGCDIPVVGLFGPSDWRRNHALGQADYVIAAVNELSDLSGLKTAPALARIDADRVIEFVSRHGLMPPADQEPSKD